MSAAPLNPTVWPNKIGLFLAGSLARHLLLLAYDSVVAAMDKTYLVELAVIVLLFGTKETKVSQQRSEPETSR